MIKVHTINILPNNSIFLIGSLMTTRNVFTRIPVESEYAIAELKILV